MANLFYQCPKCYNETTKVYEKDNGNRICMQCAATEIFAEDEGDVIWRTINGRRVRIVDGEPQFGGSDKNRELDASWKKVFPTEPERGKWLKSYVRMKKKFYLKQSGKVESEWIKKDLKNEGYDKYFLRSEVEKEINKYQEDGEYNEFQKLNFIGISKLKSNPEQYKLVDMNKVRTMKAVLDRGEQLSPITVDKDYNVIDGHHRLKAYEIAGIKDVPIEVMSKYDFIPEEEIDHWITLPSGARFPVRKDRIGKEKGLSDKVEISKKIQKIANIITEKYKVPKIEIKTSDISAKGQAAYNTWKVKGGKINNPKNITIYDWKDIAGSKGEVIHRVAHELAHHVSNMKTGSLEHSGYQGQLEDEIGSMLNKSYE